LSRLVRHTYPVLRFRPTRRDVVRVERETLFEFELIGDGNDPFGGNYQIPFSLLFFCLDFSVLLLFVYTSSVILSAQKSSTTISKVSFEIRIWRSTMASVKSQAGLND
jgi:hypothetical protein